MKNKILNAVFILTSVLVGGVSSNAMNINVNIGEFEQGNEGRRTIEINIDGEVFRSDTLTLARTRLTTDRDMEVTVSENPSVKIAPRYETSSFPNSCEIETVKMELYLEKMNIRIFHTKSDYDFDRAVGIYLKTNENDQLTIDTSSNALGIYKMEDSNYAKLKYLTANSTERIYCGHGINCDEMRLFGKTLILQTGEWKVNKLNFRSDYVNAWENQSTIRSITGESISGLRYDGFDGEIGEDIANARTQCDFEGSLLVHNLQLNNFGRIVVQGINYDKRDKYGKPTMGKSFVKLDENIELLSRTSDPVPLEQLINVTQQPLAIL